MHWTQVRCLCLLKLQTTRITLGRSLAGIFLVVFTLFVERQFLVFGKAVTVEQLFLLLAYTSVLPHRTRHVFIKKFISYPLQVYFHPH